MPVVPLVCGWFAAGSQGVRATGSRAVCGCSMVMSLPVRRSGCLARLTPVSCLTPVSILVPGGLRTVRGWIDVASWLIRVCFAVGSRLVAPLLLLCSWLPGGFQSDHAWVAVAWWLIRAWIAAVSRTLRGRFAAGSRFARGRFEVAAACSQLDCGWFEVGFVSGSWMVRGWFVACSYGFSCFPASSRLDPPPTFGGWFVWFQAASSWLVRGWPAGLSPVSWLSSASLLVPHGVRLTRGWLDAGRLVVCVSPCFFGAPGWIMPGLLLVPGCSVSGLLVVRGCSVFVAFCWCRLLLARGRFAARSRVCRGCRGWLPVGLRLVRC